MTRRGVTLIELVVAFGLVTLVVILLFTHVRQSARREGRTDKEARFAFQMALLYEYLSMDLHSASVVEKEGPDAYKIRRWRDGGDRAEEVVVHYRIDRENRRIEREVEGGEKKRFDFQDLVPERMDFRLEVEAIES